MRIISIAAIAENRAIGKDNRLLWRLPDDMKFFREQTMGNPIITGRKNYESIPEKFRPLPGRENIVITRQKDYNAPGTIVLSSIQEVLNYSKSQKYEKVFVIGGGEIYRSFHEQNLIDELLITHVHEKFEADTFYPEIDFSILNSETLFKKDKDERHPYSFTIKRYWRVV